MFGARRRRELEAKVVELEEKLAAHEARLEELFAGLASDPDANVRFLVAHAAKELGRELEKMSARLREGREALPSLDALRKSLEAALTGGEAHPGRFEPEWGRVYRAERTGYVSVYFDGGYPDKVKLLVGPTDPPTEVVCVLNKVNDMNSYAGGVVRRGEYFRLESERPAKSSMIRLFTPFL